MVVKRLEVDCGEFVQHVLTLGMVAMGLIWGVAQVNADERPNVVFILADDLGWSDTTLFETTKFYRTPNIERLAQRGMTFTHAYAASPLCSPTRSAILTGLSPARTGVTTPNCHLPTVRLAATPGSAAAPNQKVIQPDPVTRLDPKYYTLAEMFQDQGYATGHFGKWHLGAEPYSPLEHGFDVDIPHWHGPGPAGSFVAPWKYPDFDPNTPTEHIEDRMAQEAAAFMKSNQDKPFFLNYWMFSVHAPFDAKQELIEEYRGRVNPKDPQRSPTYAAMVESMDDAVGTLMDTLDELGVADNTIIVFASDNGGNMYNEVDGTTPTSNAPLRGGKATMFEGGVRGPAIVAYPSTVTPGSRSDVVIQSEDFYPTFLDWMSVKPQDKQIFDGVSLLPVLRGGSIERDAVFQYFPHAPGVPDWLPPAVSVHQNDWKLIRLFHQGDAGAHRYKLFHLDGDLGETKDLTAEMPEKVAQLDVLITDFLDRTGAVTPIVNPRFDPSKYDPSREGVQTVKKPAGGSRKPAKQRPPVAGWSAGGTSDVGQKDGMLVVISHGGDPYISAVLPKRVELKKCNVVISMKSKSNGGAQVFWKGKRNAFGPDRTVEFMPTYDGNVHQYTVAIEPTGGLQSIRIDPGRAAGESHFESIEIQSVNGETVHRWTF